MVPTFLPTGGSRRISASASDRAGSGGKRRSHMGLQITHVWYITTTLIIQKLSDSDKNFSRNKTTTKTTKSAYWGRYTTPTIYKLLLFFYILLLYYHSFFRLRTQLIAGSLISLFFLLFTIIFMMKKWYQILHFIHYYKPPFIDIDPPTINCFYMKKPVSSHNIIIAILVILSYKNKTKRKKHTWRKKKLWWQLFHTWIKQQKWFYYLRLSIIFLVLIQYS